MAGATSAFTDQTRLRFFRLGSNFSARSHLCFNQRGHSGAYALCALDANAVPLSSSLTHAAGARFWLPTENEWYRAAFHKQGDGRPEGYFEYGTGSSVKPTGSLPGSVPNTANITDCCGGASGPGVPTPVGAYTANRSPYGAYDMAGNTIEVKTAGGKL